MYLHTHDGQLVSSISARWYQMTIICFAREHNHGFCVSPSVRLVNEFNNMPVPSKAKQQGKTLENMSEDFLDSCSVSITDVWFVTVPTAVGEKVMKDVRPGSPFEPTYIYRLLTLIKSSLSEKVNYAASASDTVTA